MILVRITVQSYTISKKAVFRFVAFVFLYVSKTKKRAEAPFLSCYQTDGKASTRGFRQFQSIAFFHGSLRDGIGLRVSLVVGSGGVGVDGAVILSALVEEVELNDGLVTVLVALTADEPVRGALRLAGHGDVVGRLGLEIDTLVPVAGHVAYELESIVELLVVFG